jgi:cold shock CspA family protein
MVGAPRRGQVESFDRDVGLGEVRGRDTRLYPFHCTEITDGTRDIAVGAEVSFIVAPGHKGMWEARAVTVVPEPA